MRKKFLVFCCAAALAVSAAGCSPAEKAPAQETQTEQQTEAPETEESSQEAKGSAQEMAAAPQTVKFYGTVTRPEGSEGDQLLMNAAIEGVEGQQEVILNISEETLILDAVEGLPIKLEDIKDGDMVYSYMSPAMTASLPPQSFAYMILANIPADYRVPALEEVKELTVNEDGSAVVEAVSGTVYQVPADCVLLPYLTRNMVTIGSLTEGRNFLVWSELGEDGKEETASKIVMFQDGQLAFDTLDEAGEEAADAAETGAEDQLKPLS